MTRKLDQARLRYEREREKWLEEQKAQKQSWLLRLKRTDGSWDTRKFKGTRNEARERVSEILNSRDDYDYAWMSWEQK